MAIKRKNLALKILLLGIGILSHALVVGGIIMIIYATQVPKNEILMDELLSVTYFILGVVASVFTYCEYRRMKKVNWYN